MTCLHSITLSQFRPALLPNGRARGSCLAFLRTTALVRQCTSIAKKHTDTQVSTGTLDHGAKLMHLTSRREYVPDLVVDNVRRDPLPFVVYE